MLAEVRGAGGEVYGVVAQGQAAADQAKEAWGLGFEQWSDPQVEIATHMNDVGMASIEIDVEFARSMSKAVHTDTGEIPGGAYEVGVLQPAIVVVEKGQPDTALVSWSSVSASHNIGGAVGRPSAAETVAAVEAALGGAEGYETWRPESTHGRQIPFPLPVFVLALFANGNFIRPKGFGLDENGQGSVNGPLMRALGKGGAAVGGSAVLAAVSPRLRAPVAGVWAAWVVRRLLPFENLCHADDAGLFRSQAYAYFAHRELLQSVWKVGTAEPERPKL